MERNITTSTYKEMVGSTFYQLDIKETNKAEELGSLLAILICLLFLGAVVSSFLKLSR